MSHPHPLTPGHAGQRAGAAAPTPDLQLALGEAGLGSAEKRAGGCSRPVRLTGSTMVVNKETGELRSTYSSNQELDGTTYVKCGSRRAAVCPSCSHEYKGDAWHLLMCGLAGGKGIPASFVTSVLPGALFTFAFERENARTTTADFNERLLTFASTSALFGMLSTPLLYQGYRLYIVTGALKKGRATPVVGLGHRLRLCGRPTHTRSGHRYRRAQTMVLARPITGPEPDPRGWDLLFKTPDLGGYVKLRLKEPGAGNPWIMGLWAKPNPGTTSLLPASYAAGYPYEQDLYLIDTCEIGNDGTPVVDASGHAVLGGSALLVRWSEVAYAEFIKG